MHGTRIQQPGQCYVNEQKCSSYDITTVDAYRFTDHLLALERYTPVSGQPVSIPAAVHVVCSPLNVSAWQRALQDHPDQRFVGYILEGIVDGFHIGFDRSHSLLPARRNLPSAEEHGDVLASYIEKELALGRFVGPFDASPTWHINRVGVIPKGHTPGKWRMITDLSFPPNASVNDGIDTNLCSLSYVTVDHVASMAVNLGVGSLLAKVDIEAAYRLVPVHPDDRPLLAMQWKGGVYVDAMLPFGLRSAPKIFTAIADGLEWIARRRGVSRIEHYLDDFIILGPPQINACRRDLDTLLALCAELGVPLAGHKLEGPCTCLSFLGIEVDTVAGELRLPAEKLRRLKATLREWYDRKACTRRELESLIGSLNHACKVIRPGRSFLRRIIDLLHRASLGIARRAHHHIRLNREFRSDVLWWKTFAEEWNGISVWKRGDQPTIEFASDASGRWGCGAWCGNEWLQVRWPDSSIDLPIAVKELVPIALAGATWGRKWRKQKVRCLCDNEAVVAVMSSRTSRQPHLMHLLRCIFFIEAQHDFQLSCTHIMGKSNDLADDLSRNRLSSFLSKVPGAAPPTPVPTQLIDVLLDGSMDWLSHRWTAQFISSVKKA